jgi:transcriptional regulator with XRE-family HTH domain
MARVATPNREARKLATLRTRRKLTLRQLADASGVAHSTIHGIETGRHGAGLDTWMHLADALNVGVEVFLPQLRRTG